MSVFPDLSRYDRVGVDTETTGLTYDDRPVGISWATPDGKKGYIRWGHELGGNNCSKEEAKDWARKELSHSHLTTYYHNAAFDLRMLAYESVFPKARAEDTGFMAALHNELEPRFSLDALALKYVRQGKSGDALWQWCADTFGGKPTRKSQGKNIWRAPGDLVEEYAEDDADLTLRLGDALRPKITDEDLDEVYELETSLIPILLKMHLVGVKVDVDKALALKKEFTAEYIDLQAQWEREFGDVSFTSTPQLAKLFDKLGIPYLYTDKGNPSITADYLDTLQHPIAFMIRRLKKLKHYRGTFIDSYILENVDEDGFIHGEFHPLRNDRYGTVSGRFSSGGGLNLQNIPSRDEEMAPKIRGLYVPLDGLQWLRADYSQIEFRYLAHYAGGALREAYVSNPGVDFHQACADLVGIPRKPAKNINFGLVYGMGVKLMAQQLGVSVAEANKLLSEYHSRLPDVKRLYSKADRRAARRGYILTWGGRKRRFRKKGSRYINTHKALNALLQGSAADLIKKAMVAVADGLDWERTPMHLTVHDELDFSVPPGKEGKLFCRELKEKMEDFNLTVPVKVDLELGPDWGHCEEIDLAA